MPPERSRHAEGEAVEREDRLLSDAGDEQAEEARHPALERIVAGEISRDHDTEYREPEELVGAEFQRHLAEHRREECKRHHADPGAEDRAGSRDAHRAAGESLLGERVAVEAGGSRGGCAGNIEQDCRSAAAVDRADIGANEDEQRVVRRQLDGERRHQRDAHRGGKAGQGADDETDEARDERVTDCRRCHEAEKRRAEPDDAVKHAARSRYADQEYVLEAVMNDEARNRRRRRQRTRRRGASVPLAAPVGN